MNRIDNENRPWRGVSKHVPVIINTRICCMHGVDDNCQSRRDTWQLRSRLQKRRWQTTFAFFGANNILSNKYMTNRQIKLPPMDPKYGKSYHIFIVSNNLSSSLPPRRSLVGLSKAFSAHPVCKPTPARESKVNIHWQAFHNDNDDNT